MKITRTLAFLFALLLSLGLFVTAGAEGESGDSSGDNSAAGNNYDYVIKYGYMPLVYAGAEAQDYVTGPTPATAYVKAGENHVVAESNYKFRDYVFIGWRSEGKLYKPGEIIYNVNSDITFTAAWGRPESPEMTVLGIISYSKGGKVVESASAKVGSTVTLKDGYWKDGCGRIFNGGSKFLLSFTSVDFTEAAKGVSTVSVKYDGGVSSGVQGCFAVEKGGSFLVDGCFGVKEGYTFTGWKDGNGKIYTVGDTCVANSDVTFTAIWRENEKPAPDYCSVTVTVGEGGVATPEGKSTVEKGNSFTFTVSAKKGYKLISVTADGAEIGVGGEYTLTVNADMAIKASFEKLPEEISKEESVEESAEESATISTEESNTESKDESNVSNNGDDKDGGIGKIVTIVVAVILCVGCVALAAWFSAKSNKKRR